MKPSKLKGVIEEILRNRILFIGDGKDVAGFSRHNSLQIYTGCPDDLIKELTKAVAEQVLESEGE